MENPWKNLGSEAGFLILPCDRVAIERYNCSQRDPITAVATESVPEPFIGNPESARLVLLGLNPGHSEDDVRNHRDPHFRAAMFLNLKHELRDYPFYPLNPAFSHTGAGQWWNKILKSLKRESRLDDVTLSRMLMVIEWFPYHSEKSGLPTQRICASQEYSLFLAERALNRMLNKDLVIVLGMRSRSHWLSSDPAFHNVSFLRNKQRPFISRGNMDEGLFDSILKLICQEADSKAETTT
jgi:hypothetical protein